MSPAAAFHSSSRVSRASRVPRSWGAHADADVLPYVRAKPEVEGRWVTVDAESSAKDPVTAEPGLVSLQHERAHRAQVLTGHRGWSRSTIDVPDPFAAPGAVAGRRSAVLRRA